MSCTPAPLWGLWAGPSGLQWDVGSPAAPTYPGGGLPSWGPLGCSHLFWNRPRSGLPGPAGCAGAAGVCSRGSPEPPRALPQTTGCGIPRSGVCRVAPGSPPYCPAPPRPPGWSHLTRASSWASPAPRAPWDLLARASGLSALCGEPSRSPGSVLLCPAPAPPRALTVLQAVWPPPCSHALLLPGR